ncbi:MAG: hypothetical protein AAGA16_00790 [Cyanobacteria bacterium P01_E01_bin.35]
MAIAKLLAIVYGEYLDTKGSIKTRSFSNEALQLVVWLQQKT